MRSFSHPDHAVTTASRRHSVNGVFAIIVHFFIIGAYADSFDLKKVQIDGKQAHIASVRLSESDTKLSLYWKGPNGAPLRDFDSLKSSLKNKQQTLLFAANAGIYRDSPSLAPIGLHVENGKTLARLSFANNCGNFCWYSGVFYIHGNRAFIVPREEVSTLDFSDKRLAIQSGPLFMRSGKLQGSWSETSYNLNRSAVCTTARSDEVLMILVSDPTNFGQFFQISKQAGCLESLFLDGHVSSFYDGDSRLGNPFESYAGFLAVVKQ